MNNFDSSQIRTPVTRRLLGYVASKNGNKGIALMHHPNKENAECLGFISLSELVEIINTGPYVNLDK